MQTASLKLLIFLASLLLFTSCNHQRGAVPENNSKPSIRFYYRDVGCNNGVCSYGDFILLNNYENKRYTVKQMADLAIKYMDTAKADLPISSVTILGEPFGTTLPPGMTKTYYEHADYQVVSFGFPKLAPGYRQTVEGINSIALWKKGEGELFYAVDSLLSSKVLLDNEN